MCWGPKSVFASVGYRTYRWLHRLAALSGDSMAASHICLARARSSAPCISSCRPRLGARVGFGKRRRFSFCRFHCLSSGTSFFPMRMGPGRGRSDGDPRSAFVACVDHQSESDALRTTLHANFGSASRASGCGLPSCPRRSLQADHSRNPGTAMQFRPCRGDRSPFQTYFGLGGRLARNDKSGPPQAVRLTVLVDARRAGRWRGTSRRFARRSDSAVHMRGCLCIGVVLVLKGGSGRQGPGVVSSSGQLSPAAVPRWQAMSCRAWRVEGNNVARSSGSGTRSHCNVATSHIN